MISQITQKLSEASVSLIELTLKTLKKDSSELTQSLVMISLKSSVHDYLNLVMISLKMLEDSDNYVLDLNAVNYADYLTQ